MAKLLVDTQTNKIRGYYEEPLDFSISGRYVLDIPNGIYPETDVVADAITDKLGIYGSYHPNLVNILNDELLDPLAANAIDPTISSGYFLGPNKRTEVLPAGYVYTNPMVLAVAPPVVGVLIHFHGFTLYSDPGAVVSHPAPSRLLYNYNPSTSFFDFDPDASFLVEIVDAAAPYTSRHTFTHADAIDTPAPGITSPIRLKFTNIGAVRYHLSDWILMYG